MTNALDVAHGVCINARHCYVKQKLSKGEISKSQMAFKALKCHEMKQKHCKHKLYGDVSESRGHVRHNRPKSTSPNAFSRHIF